MSQTTSEDVGVDRDARLGPMPTLPRSNSSLLVRTDFTSDDAWQQVSDEAQWENEDGFRAYLEPVSDPAFDRARWEEVKAAVPAGDRKAMVLFAADSTALTAPDNPVLVVDLLHGRPPFRAIVSGLWAIENNLNIANIDWEEFAEAAGDDGIFRGFSGSA